MRFLRIHRPSYDVMVNDSSKATKSNSRISLQLYMTKLDVICNTSYKPLYVEMEKIMRLICHHI